MKKIVLLASLAVVLLVVALFTLLKSPDAQQQNGIVQQKSDDLIELKFGHHMPQDSVLNKAALRFADEVVKKTQGKVKITVYPNQELGSSGQMMELSRLGQIDILLTATAKHTPLPFNLQF